MQLTILFSAPPGARAAAVADLLARDYEVLRTADLASAFAAWRRRRPAAAVLPLPGEAGEPELIRRLEERHGRTAVILYSADGPPPPQAALRALTAGARAVLDATAPNFAEDLRGRLTRVMEALRRRRTEDEARAGLFAPHHVVGASPAMQDVFRRAIKASQFGDLPVLIEGERGTPKRRLAAAVVALDAARARRPFFALGCADLHRLLAQRRDPAGGPGASVPAKWRDLLRAARGGTVFLDEIACLDRELQRVLLEVARRPSSEVRVIAATTRPAPELVAGGVLDAELAGWLGLFRIPLPSLRGRPEDIAAQARHALHAWPAAEPPRMTEFGPGVLAVLQRLPWERNTRELEAMLRRALATGKGGTALLLDDLPPEARAVRPDGPLPEPVPHPGDWVADATAEGGHPLDAAAEEYERRLLRRLLARQGAGSAAVSSAPPCRS